MEELLSCSKMLSNLTYENHENEYDSLLETRERCIETLNSIGSALQSELQLSDKVVIGTNEAIAVLNDRVKILVQEIVALDNQNKAAITAELQNLKMRISALNSGRKGISGYKAVQQVNTAGIYTDSRK